MSLINYRQSLIFLLKKRKSFKMILRAIAIAVIKLCERDTNLLANNRRRERFCHFRIAYYLANILERRYKGFFIDCEFDKNNSNEKLVEINGEKQGVRPDIIYHNRNKKNIFVIEIKIGELKHDSRQSKFEDDRDKVYHYLSDKGLHYIFGFCISDIYKNKFTIHHIFNKYTNGCGQERIYKFCKKPDGWTYSSDVNTFKIRHQ